MFTLDNHSRNVYSFDISMTKGTNGTVGTIIVLNDPTKFGERSHT